MKTFDKVTKKYALNNSYFKNRNFNMPGNPFEVFEYYLQHKELPYSTSATLLAEMIYECFIEFQKRNTIYRSQFFTPPAVAKQMAEIADDYFNDDRLLDACCGFGILSSTMLELGYKPTGFDIDCDFNHMYRILSQSVMQTLDINDINGVSDKFKSIISNPPYELPLLTVFMEQLYKWLDDDGVAVLLIPKGFVDKDRPKNLVSILNKFSVEYRESACEPFARTGVGAEIVVLHKNQ